MYHPFLVHRHIATLVATRHHLQAAPFNIAIVQKLFRDQVVANNYMPVQFDPAQTQRYVLIFF